MNLSDYSGYIGRMKQPLQHPNIDSPTTFMIADSMKNELDIILLTPGTYLHVYNYIKKYNAYSVRIFVPSIGPEFISDVFNLIMSLRNLLEIKWVFPYSYNHYTFNQYHISTNSYENTNSREIFIRYIPNKYLDNVYDIFACCRDNANYFSMKLEKDDIEELYNNKEITNIHIPMSSTIYGGLTYEEIIKIDRKYKLKFVPNDFSSTEECYFTFNREIPCDEFYNECE